MSMMRKEVLTASINLDFILSFVLILQFYRNNFEVVMDKFCLDVSVEVNQ